MRPVAIIPKTADGIQDLAQALAHSSGDVELKIMRVV